MVFIALSSQHNAVHVFVVILIIPLLFLLVVLFGVFLRSTHRQVHIRITQPHKSTHNTGRHESQCYIHTYQRIPTHSQTSTHSQFCSVHSHTCTVHTYMRSQPHVYWYHILPKPSKSSLRFLLAVRVHCAQHSTAQLNTALYMSLSMLYTIYVYTKLCVWNNSKISFQFILTCFVLSRSKPLCWV